MKRTIQPVQVYVSSQIDAPIDAVWGVVRDFNALPKWHPAISESHIENGRESSTVGCIRNFALTGGSRIREQLLALSDTNYLFAYSILESDLGLWDYVAEFRLFRITDGDSTFAIWSAAFRTEKGQESEKAQLVEQEVFLRGFAALKLAIRRN